ncbi:MAG: MATE family efflux transporter [Eubacteriales bacterium]|nr:MATE family efflux transporter [Eubacteriales bacterium]
MKKESANPLGTLPVNTLLRQFTVPAVISMVVTAVYNIVDQIFIGHGIGPAANASTTVAFPLVISIMAVALLFGIGSAIFIGTRLGEGRHDLAEKALQSVTGVLIVLSAIITVAGLIFIEPVVRFFGADEQILTYSIQYTSVILCGSLFNMMTIVLDKILRVDGAPKVAMFSIMAGVSINTVLDPLFIFVFQMGVSGAALATIFSQFISAACMFVYLQKKGSLHVRLRGLFRPDFDTVRKVAYLGLSSFILQIGALIVQVVMNRSLMYYGALTPEVGGVIALAGMGVIMKFYIVIISVCVGIGVGAQPIISFNNGARRYDRVRETIRKTIFLTTVVTFTGWLLVETVPGLVIRLFDNRAGVFYLFSKRAIRIFLAMAFTVGPQIACSQYYQAMGKPLISAFLSVLRQILVLLPAILILPLIFGLDGILFSGPLSEMVSGTVCFLLFRKEWKQLNERIRNNEQEI